MDDISDIIAKMLNALKYAIEKKEKLISFDFSASNIYIISAIQRLLIDKGFITLIASTANSNGKNKTVRIYIDLSRKRQQVIKNEANNK